MTGAECLICSGSLPYAFRVQFLKLKVI